ncbi:phosphoribosyl-ATP diphosphatase [Acidisphaera sp. S103]|uniref:phosphoribosyl-ATP diphosphatase n=1 Tax=Acidisphaera sp. S103 TaxID=1747223 RepID=UPI00131D298C|nr:phosphoribosyl-ATP diphosphatase [Acidisphaera sp. S103]
MAKSTKKKTAAGRPKASVKVSRTAGGKSKKTRVAKVAAAPVVSDAVVLDRLFAVIESRRGADPTVSHSARLLSRGPAKVAQKFGEEAVECLIEAVAGNRDALIAESADVLYHLLVLWVSSDVGPEEVWAELIRREGISGIAEKAARAKPVVVRRKVGTSKIP